MSLVKFAADLERYGCQAVVNDSVVNIDFEELQFYIEFDENWIKIINKVYRAKQYELNHESKFQVSNSNIEF